MRLSKSKVLLECLLGLNQPQTLAYIARLDRPTVEKDFWTFIQPPPNVQVKVFHLNTDNERFFAYNYIYKPGNGDYESWEHNKLAWRYDLEWLENSYADFIAKKGVVYDALQDTILKLDIDLDKTQEIIDEVITLLTKAVYNS